MSLFSKIKKAKDAANKYKKSITNKRDEKGNARNYFTPLSPNQKKPPTKKQQIVKNQKINTRLQDKSKPPEPPKSRPKVNTKQLMMKEGKTKKDSNVKFDSEVKKGKK